MKYSPDQPLGRGAMGEVYRAWDESLERHVALKLLRRDDPELAERFLREARLQARVRHDHVCEVYDVGLADDGRPYIAMQYIEGQTLEALAPTLELADTLRLLRQIAQGVQAAHDAGLIHRDLKPSNVMVQRRGEGWHAWVLDFGLAREREAPGLTQTGSALGTPPYMAPEQIQAPGSSLDPRTDVYALGAVLYEMLAGHPPFQGASVAETLMAVLQNDPPRLPPTVPADVQTIVFKCLEKDRTRRYPSARALDEDLARCLAGEPLHARPPSRGERMLRRIHRNRAASLAAAAALAVALGLGGVWVHARWTAARQAALAHRFGTEVEQMESALRGAYLLPLHDTRPAKSSVRGRMAAIQEQMQQLGSVSHGPARYALGRGHLVLREYTQAVRELEGARADGYDRPEVAAALGEAMGELYRKALDDMQRIRNKTLREARRARIEKSLRDPALAHLRSAGQVGSAAPYADSLIAFYERRYREAITAARQAIDARPAFYEARRLEADAGTQLGMETLRTGDYDGAVRLFDEARAAYQQALEIARSDASLHEGECATWLGMLEARVNHGGWPGEFFEAAIAACDRALQADAESARALSLKSYALVRQAEHAMKVGADPRPHLDRAAEFADAAVAFAPSDARIHNYRGTVFVVRVGYESRRGLDIRDSFEKATASLNRTIALDPTVIEAYVNLAHLQIDRGDDEFKVGRDPRPVLEQAVANLRKAAALSPELAEIFIYMGIGYRIRAEYETSHGEDARAAFDEAVKSYRQAMKVNPAHPYPIPNLGNCLNDRARYELDRGLDPSGSLKEAEAVLAKARQTMPQAFEVWHALGDQATIAGRWAIGRGASPAADFDAAAAHYQHAQKLNGDFAGTPAREADLYRWRAAWAAGQGLAVNALVDRGLAAAARAARIDPRVMEAHAFRGALLLIRARAETDRARRAEAARQSAAALARALENNKLLEREFAPLLAEAKALT